MNMLSIVTLLLLNHCTANRLILSSDSLSSSSSSSSENNDDCLLIQDKCLRQKCLVDLVYQSIIYPSSLDITLGLKAAPSFSSDVYGRVNPVGTFKDHESSKEYFYSLVNGQGLYNRDNPGAVVQDVFKVFAVCENDVVSIRYDVLLRDDAPGPQTPEQEISECFIYGYNLTQTGFYKFNDDGTEIISFDLNLINLDESAKYASSSSCNPVTQQQQIYGICAIEDEFCNDIDNQYDSFSECLAYLSQKEFGNQNQDTHDTVSCRTIHLLLVPVRPEVHCNHIGPQSTKCIDREYSDYYKFNI